MRRVTCAGLACCACCSVLATCSIMMSIDAAAAALGSAGSAGAAALNFCLGDTVIQQLCQPPTGMPPKPLKRHMSVQVASFIGATSKRSASTSRSHACLLRGTASTHCLQVCTGRVQIQVLGNWPAHESMITGTVCLLEPLEPGLPSTHPSVAH